MSRIKEVMQEEGFFTAACRDKILSAAALRDNFYIKGLYYENHTQGN
jgi:hypothetical protein